MGVSIHFEMTAPGAAACRLTVGERSLLMTVSYLEDALEHLTAAASDLASGTRLATLTLTEEPGEFDWTLEAQGDDLRVRVAWREDVDRATGRVLLDESCRLREFADAVSAAVTQVAHGSG